jgi:hypothetical protein
MRSRSDPHQAPWFAVARLLRKYGISIREHNCKQHDRTGHEWEYGFQSARVSFHEMSIGIDERTCVDDLLHEGVHLILGERSLKDNEAHVLLPFEWALVTHVARKLEPEARSEFVTACDDYQRGTLIYSSQADYVQLRSHDRYSDFWARGLRMAIKMGVLTADLKPAYKIAHVQARWTIYSVRNGRHTQTKKG